MKPLIIALFIALAFQAPTAQAVTPLSAETLDSYCKNFSMTSKSVLSQKCIAYVGGFLDGAVATDERVAENVAAEIEREESLTERAYRTRVAGRMRVLGPSVYAEFCIGDPVPIADVIMHVIEELDSHKSFTGMAARTIVYDSVRKHYPCKEE